MITQGNTRGRQTAPAPKISFIPIDKWDKGQYTRLDTDRTPTSGLRTTENVQLNQNGTVQPRPGTKLYGLQPTGQVLGQIYEFIKFNTAVTPNVPETWLIRMEVRSGVGRVIVSKNGGAETVVSGKTYSATAFAHFEQVYGKVMISNGVDTLSYMDIDTLTITAFTQLAQPTGVSAVATGVNGTGPYTLRYRVTAANQGETAASVAQTVTVTKLREVWNGTTEYVTFKFNRVTGALRYNIYVGDTPGSEYFLDSVADSGTGTTQDYVDTGSIAETTTRVAPVGDSTAGPRVTRITNIKGQPYMVGDTDNPGRIWFGGNGQSALDFSSFNGGGWVEPNKGGKDFPVIVKPFRDGKGTPMAACISKSSNGAGKRYLLQPQTTTLGSTVITFMSVQEDNGADGTDSPDGVILQDDGLWYPSRTAFKVTNTKASIQNILSTNGISDNIAPNVQNLSPTAMDKCVGLPLDRRLYWALPYNTNTNSQIWVLDLRQEGAWTTPWYVAADWLWLYNDNTDGKTKFLALVNNKIVEFDQSTKTNDLGVTFSTNIGSGAIKFDENGINSGSVIDVIFKFLNPEGNINMSVTVDTEDGPMTFADTMPGGANQSVSGFGQYGYGAAGYGNISPPAAPIGISNAKPFKFWTIEIDQECESLAWGVSTIDPGVSYQLAEVIVRYSPIGYKDKDN